MNKVAENTRITYSQLSTFSKCARKAELEYEYGIRRTEESRAMRRGTIFHEGMNALWTEKGDCGGILNSHWNDWEDSEWHVVMTQLYALLAAYRQHYIASGQHKDISVLEVEEVFDVDGHLDMRYSGKKDKVVSRNGKALLVEHKSVGDSVDISPGSDYQRRLYFDEQISYYLIASQRADKPLDGVMYDITKMPSTKPKELTQEYTKILMETGEYRVAMKDPDEIVTVGRFEWQQDEETNEVFITPEDSHCELATQVEHKKMNTIIETPNMYLARLVAEISRRPERYFQRVVLTRRGGQIAAAGINLTNKLKNLHAARRYGWWPQSTSFCLIGGKCPCFELCATGFDPATEDVLPEGYIQVDNIHQELE